MSSWFEEQLDKILFYRRKQKATKKAEEVEKEIQELYKVWSFCYDTSKLSEPQQQHNQYQDRQKQLMQILQKPLDRKHEETILFKEEKERIEKEKEDWDLELELEGEKQLNAKITIKSSIATDEQSFDTVSRRWANTSGKEDVLTELDSVESAAEAPIPSNVSYFNLSNDVQKSFRNSELIHNQLFLTQPSSTKTDFIVPID